MTLAEAARHPWQVVVAGAGPAGSVTARQLALEGASVLLVDRAVFPRPKVCGCCLNRAALGTLEAIGLGEVVPNAGAPRLSRMHLAVGSSHATLPLPGGAALSRERLDAALIDEARAAGAAFLPGTEAVLLPGNGTHRRIRLRSGGQESEVRTGLAIAADGLGGTFLRMTQALAPRVAADSPIGVGAVFDEAPGNFEPGTIYMACGREAYVGAVRLEDGRVDVAAAVRRRRRGRSSGLGPLIGDTLRRAGFPLPRDFDEAEWRGTPPMTRSRPRVAAHRTFVVGDSAGYVEPFTGEGMAWAIQGAVLLIPHARAALEQWDANAPDRWERTYRRFFGARKRVCALIRTVLRHPRAARSLVALLGLAPGLAGPGMRRISSPDPVVRAIVEGRSS